MKYFLVVSIIFLCSFSNPQKKTENKLFTIQLGENMSNKKEIGLKEIAKNIEYVKLEFKPEFAIGSIRKFIATEKYFFVASDEVYQFLRTGEFVRKIGKQGRGPAEYPVVVDLTIDESTQKIYVLPAPIKQILVFDFNGIFLNTIQLPDRYIESIDAINKGGIALQSGMNINTTLSTEIINEQGKSILQFNSRIFNKIDPANEGKTANVVYQYNNDFFVKECKNDTVYKITNTGLIPHFIYNLGKYKPPLVCSESEWSKYDIIYRIFETDSHIFTFFIHNKSGCVARYNKVTKEVNVSIPSDDSESGIKNDFDYGANLFLTLHEMGYKSNQKEWILPLYSNSLSKFKGNTKITGNFKTIINQLDENDNPVIMVIKLK
jgi:hypothetical protein